MPRADHLRGLRVIDFSAVFAGPICARMLRDCGADVIKIETPAGGDVIRGVAGRSRVFAHFNAGKRSVAIDLTTADGQRIARDLTRDADVVVENFRPGVMDRFGLGHAALMAENARLVYCSISGFGQTGPESQRAAYAPIAHASSGYDAAHQRAQPDPDGRPANSSIMIADMLTGAYAFGAIQTALLGRERSGRGDYVDVTMVESMMMLIPGQMQAAQIDRPLPPGGFAPIRTRDGFVMVCIVSDKNLQQLFQAIGRPELLQDERFGRGNRMNYMKELVEEVEKWSAPLDTLECERLLNAAQVPCSRYVDPAEQFEREQLRVLGTFTQMQDPNGEFRIQNAPFRMASGSISAADFDAALGEHTESVLSERLGIGAQELAELRARGVFG